MRQQTRLACALALALLLTTTITSVSLAEFPIEDGGLVQRDRVGRQPQIMPDPHASAEPGDDDMPNKDGIGPAPARLGGSVQTLGNRWVGVSWFQEKWQGMHLLLSQWLKALR